MKGGRFTWLAIPWFLFAGIVVGWIIYWNVVASSAEQRVAAWEAHQNAAGAQASHSHIARRGFPVLLRLEIQNISYAPALGGWRLQTARADLNVDMLNPQHVIFKARAPIAISRDDGAVTNIGAQSLVVSVRTQDGALAVAGIEADQLTLDDPAQPGVLGLAKLVVNMRPDPRRAGDYQVAFEADNLTLPRPVRSLEGFGLNAPLLRAAIVVEQGDALLRGARGDPLGPWREAGGKLRFEALDLHWGALEASATGEGGLDGQRRLQGRITSPIAHPAPVLSAISRGEGINDSARAALRLLAASYIASGQAISLDIGAQDGVLSIEGLSVRRLAAVY